MNQHKVFLKRINQIKHKMGQEMSYRSFNIADGQEKDSQAQQNSLAGHRKRSEDMLSTNASRAMINAIASKSELSGPLTQ